MKQNTLIKFWNNFRLKYNALTQSSNYLVEVNKALYRRIGGHNKVIHWREGQPVYSSFYLAGYTKAKANMQAVRTIASMQNRVIPYMVDIAVTDKCNFDCMHCSFKSIEDKKQIMTTNEIKNIIAQCQTLGVSMINFLGGEPLLRPDILELIKSVDKDQSGTLMFTNGWRLEEYAHKLKKAGLDSVNVSLDSHIPQEHDKMRKAKGSFKRALKGIKAAKKAGLTVGISCTITKETLKNKTFLKLVELAKKLKVHEIIVFDVIPTGAFANRKDYSGDIAWTEEIVKIANHYNKKLDYPGIFAYAYNRSHPSMGCSGGTNYFYITPYAEICPCDFNPKILGSLKEKPLHILWDEITKNKDFCQTCWTGCKIQNPAYRKAQGMNFEKGAKCVSFNNTIKIK